MKVSFIFLLCFLGFVSTYNYLVVNPVFGYSHSKIITKLADVVADAGHNVTVFQAHHSLMKASNEMIKNKNTKIIHFYPDDYDEIIKINDESLYAKMWDSVAMNSPVLAAFVLPNMLSNKFRNTNTQLFKNNRAVIEDLKSKNFDAVIAETFDISGFYIAHLIDRPPIAVTSCTRFAVQHLFGQPTSVGYVPSDFAKQGSEAGFLDRLNDVYQHYSYSQFNNGLMEKQHHIYKEALGVEELPHWKELITRSPIILANSNPYLDFAMPNSGNVIPVGGFTMDLKSKNKKAEALPEEYERILKEKDTTILISFGSVARSFQMPATFKSGLVAMFKNLPNVTFIWKYEIDDEEFQKSLSPNVHLKKWVPQPALLADDRVKLFVTHGGLGSTSEVAYSGKPEFMIPLFGDQPQNAMMLSRHRGAVAYNKFDLPNSQKLTEAIQEMIKNPSYKEKAQKLREILYSPPIDPKELLVKHIEFATQFPNLQSQVPEINSAGIIGYYYIDVYIFFAVLLLVVSYVLLKITKLVVRKFLSKTEKSKNE